MQQSRRTFLKALGAASAVPLLHRHAGAARQSAPVSSQARIALQLYTVREAMEKDAAATLRRVAEMGYTWVETGFFPEGMTLAQAGQLIGDAGLRVCAAHVEIPVDEHRDALLQAADAFGCANMVWHGWPEDSAYQSLDGIRRLADMYNDAHAFASANGLRFGLHNHWWEFEPIPESDEGRTQWQQQFGEDVPEAMGGLPLLLLRPLLEPGIFFEIDTFWALVAGQDPAAVVREFGARAPLLHIKDGATLSTDGPMVAAGQGLQDFPAVAAAGSGSTEWMIVELDRCDCDMFAAAEQSFTYLTESGLASS